jgi:hypothetical protein
VNGLYIQEKGTVLGEATNTLVGANAPTAKTKFSVNYLTFTTCAPPQSMIMHPPRANMEAKTSTV